MGYITRDIYVQRRGIENPISYTRATNAQDIQFRFCDFHIPEGTEAKVYVQKPSGKAVYNTALIQGDKVMVEVTTQMFSEIGASNIQLQLVKEERTLVTFTQPVEVFQNYTEGDAPESQNESGFFESFVKETGERAVRIAQEAADEIERRADEGEFTGTVTIGEVVTGEPGSEASVENVGTAKDVVLNMTIPEGKTGEVENIDTVQISFDQAASRENIESGEMLKTILGKVRKWFSDLGTAGFRGVSNSLTTSAPGSYVLDAHQGKVLDEKKLDVDKGVNNLEATEEGHWLDAVQGKVLNEKVEKRVEASKIVESTNITEAGFLMDGKTTSDAIKGLEKLRLFSTAETKIGYLQDGTPVYRKIVKTPMTSFTQQTSGYQSVTVGLGVVIKNLVSFNIFAFSGSTFYPLPYSGDGHYGTWLQSFAKTGTQTSMRLSNNVAWGASYTLVALIEYTK